MISGREHNASWRDFASQALWCERIMSSRKQIQDMDLSEESMCVFVQKEQK